MTAKLILAVIIVGLLAGFMLGGTSSFASFTLGVSRLDGPDKLQ